MNPIQKLKQWEPLTLKPVHTERTHASNDLQSRMPLSVSRLCLTASEKGKHAPTEAETTWQITKWNEAEISCPVKKKDRQIKFEAPRRTSEKLTNWNFRTKRQPPHPGRRREKTTGRKKEQALPTDQQPDSPGGKCTLEAPGGQAKATAQATQPSPPAVPTEQSPKGTFRTKCNVV